MTDGRTVHAGEERIRALLAFGRYAEAEQAARALVATHPESAAGHEHLAQALLRLERPQEAVESARTAAGLRPDDAPFVLLSACLRAAGDRAGALEAARRAVRSQPQQWTSYLALASSHLAWGSAESAEEALPALDEAARLAPAEADVPYLRGLALSRMNRRDDARLAYERALALDPQHHAALNNLGALDVRDRPLRASERFTAAARIDPQRTTYRANIGVAIRNLLARVGYVLIGLGLVTSVTRFYVRSYGVHVGLAALAVAVYLTGLVLAWRLLPRGLRRSPRDVRGLFQGKKTGWLWVSVLLAIDAGVALVASPWAFVFALYVQTIRTAIRRLNR